MHIPINVFIINNRTQPIVLINELIIQCLVFGEKKRGKEKDKKYFDIKSNDGDGCDDDHDDRVHDDGDDPLYDREQYSSDWRLRN